MPNKKVLIVDDSNEATLLTKMALSMIDGEIKPDSRNSGRGALEYLMGAPDLPALVLLDLKMPGMDGISTLKAIRADDRFRSLPIVIVTLSSLESDRDAAYQAGATGFIHKATRIDQFAHDLKRHVMQWIQ